MFLWLYNLEQHGNRMDKEKDDIYRQDWGQLQKGSKGIFEKKKTSCNIQYLDLVLNKAKHFVVVFMMCLKIIQMIFLKVCFRCISINFQSQEECVKNSLFYQHR